MRLRLVWWHWIIIVLAVLALSAWGMAQLIRQRGIAEWRAYEAQAEAAGTGVRLDDWLATLDPVDADLQERWWSLQQDYEAGIEGFGELADEIDYAAILWAGEPVPEAVATLLAEHAELHQRTRELLREPALESSARGFAAVDHARDPGTAWAWRVPSLLASREVMYLLCHDLLCGGDRGQALADLAAYRRAYGDPGSLIDAMIAVALERIRGEAMVLAALDGLRGPDLDAWLAERQTFLGELVARSVAGEALGLEVGGGGSLRERSLGPREWLVLPGEGAAAMAHLLALSRRCRGEITTTPPPPEQGHSILVAIALPNVVESAHTGLSGQVTHRLHRLAVRLVVDGEQGLPADRDAFERRYPGALDGGPTRLELAYERLAEDRFRLAVDPTGSVPDFSDPARYTTDNHLGEPASAASLVDALNSIEVRIPPHPPASGGAIERPE